MAETNRPHRPAEGGRYVEVAVGRFAVGRFTAGRQPGLFHYRLPSVLDVTPLQLGCRLFVPFGPRIETGYFVRYIDSPDVPEIKDVQAVLDKISPLPKSLIKLLQWISEYYVSSLGAVLAGVFPKGSQQKIYCRLELTEEGKVAWNAGRVKAENAKEVMTLLINGAANEASLRRKIGAKNLTVALTSLKRKSWIKTIWEIGEPKKLGKEDKEETTTEDVVPTATIKSGLPGVASATAAVATAAGAVGPYLLNNAQKAAYDEIRTTIQKGLFVPFLLYGVTGSGKTEVYLRVIETALSQNKGAIVLVPEIGLTPQLAARFENRFGKTVALLHSGLSLRERYEAWQKIRDGKARIAIGARSALFAPMENVGVIVVDEEHDPSYKQEEGVRYHARDAALVYGKLLNATVVLGSATPSLESLYNGMSGKYKIVLLPDRVGTPAVGTPVVSRPLPTIRIIDLRLREEWVRPFLTKPLIEAIEKRLVQKEQVILFVNRRGHAPSLLCRDCGHRWLCENCSVSLAFHKRQKKLLCHYCGYVVPPPLLCPDCKGTRLLYLGVGTEQVEEEIKTLFPAARVLRMDRDTTSRKDSQNQIVSAMETREADILIGTQMVAKGHDFPDVTLVGVICADLSLNFPDFRASERTFQLLAQVAGRAGRGEQAGEVLIQTFQPEQPLFHILPDCSTFYDMESPFRKEADFPPYSRLILLQLCHRDEAEAARQAEQLASAMKETEFRPMPAKRRVAARDTGPNGAGIFAPPVGVLGPVPAPLSRLRKDYRYQILLKGKNQARLRAVLKMGLEYMRSADPKGVRLIVDVDPQNGT